MRNWLRIVVPLSVLSCSVAQAAGTTSVTKLRCEEIIDPIGLEQIKPRLSWVIDSQERNWKQKAYQILVSSSAGLLAANKGDLWNSGKVASDVTSEIVYAGKPLASRTQCFWKVRTWNSKGVPSTYSAPSKWEMGLLNKSDWHGQWIGYVAPMPAQAADTRPTLKTASWVWFPEGDPLRNAPEATRYFRRTFELPAGIQVSSANLRVAADNAAVVSVNGQDVGRSHDSWKSMDVFDVAGQLTPGANVIAISVTNEGTAAGLAAELDIKQDAGTPISVISDAHWKSNTQAAEGWKTKGYDDAAWKSALVVAKVGEGPWGAVASGGTTATYPPAPYLRRTFNAAGKIKRATAYICGLGYSELSINGKKVSDHVLDPGWTRYDRRSLYVTHDVTSLVKSGPNALGVILGTGHYDDHVLSVWDFDRATWRTPPKMLMELRVDYADGHSQTITSDGDWKASSGPITFDSISAGENYDARLELKGWDTPAFQAASWKPAKIVEPVKGFLAAQIAPPMRITKEIKPVKLTQPSSGVWLFDLGQNIAGVPQIRVQGAAGTSIAMRCAELVGKDGNLDGSNIDTFVKRRLSTQEFQTDHYTLKGSGLEVWNPRFTYHGFQYVEVKGFPGTPTLDSLRGLVLHSDFQQIGNFTCSDAMLNQTQHNAVWSYIGNFQGLPTDCPHREKNGWTGDAHLAAEMGLYNFDGAANYEKWLNDIADEQHPDGSFEGIIPTSGWGANIGPAWDSVYPQIVWYLYQYKGDKNVVAKHYPKIKRYVDYVTTRAKDGIVDYGLGDWCPAKTETPSDITSTAYYFVDAMTISKAATLLGYTEDAKKYADLAAGIRAAFNAKFYHPETATYGNGSITSLSCALYQGLVEPENKAKVIDSLVAAIKKANYNMDVGILGAKYVLNTLAENGRADVAYQMLMKRDWPSYGYWVDQGATTLWEQWNHNDSHLHVMFGDVGAWFYKYLAGIKAVSPGFKEIEIKPYVLGKMTSAAATYDSAQGKISSSWKLSDGALIFDATIPANTVATVWVPLRSGKKVIESGKPVSSSVGLKWLRDEDGYSVFAAGSGSYHFSS